MHEWFQIKMQADNPAHVDVFLNDYIGDWADQMMNDWLGTNSPITAKQIIDQLAALPESVKSILIHINSPGGDVDAAVMIANAFRDQRVTKGRTVETIVEGLAASSASLIAMAGSPMRMADNAILMIHEPWTIAMGNSADMRKTADVLDQRRNAQIVPTYQWHTPKSADEIVALMVAETWMDADEAIANGFADEKIEGLKVAASIDPRHTTKLKVPEKFAARVKALLKPEDEAPTTQAAVQPAPAPVIKPASGDHVLKACADAGLDLEFARAAIGESLTVEALSARIATEKASRAAAEERATNIRALCGSAHEDLAPELIASAMTFDQVKSHLCKVAAKLDKVDIDAGLPPEQGKGRKPAIDISAIYADLNKSFR